MNNKTNIEEDIEIIKNHLMKIQQDTSLQIRISIENILADRERLEKENMEMKIEIAENVYFGSMPLDQMRELQAKANKYDSLVEKIKEKKEELKEEDSEIYDTDSEDVIIAKYETRAMIDVLQELLDTEK